MITTAVTHVTHYRKKENTLQSIVCDALKRLMSYKPNEKLVHKTIQEVTTGKKRNLVEIAYDLIYEEVKTLTDSKDSTTTNEQAFYSPDYGKITHRQILKICKTPFRGEPGRKDSGKIDNESSCQEFHLR